MSKLKHAVAALFVLATAVPGAAQEDRSLQDLFSALREAEGETARAIEARIWQEWSKSGSPTLDLLLDRGREALEAGDIDTAIGHFSTLVDHAPDFAEGYNMRATALYQDEQVGPALKDLRTALSLNPRHFGALTGLASIFEQLGDEEAALEAWRRVHEINPTAAGAKEAIDRLEQSVDGTTL